MNPQKVKITILRIIEIMLLAAGICTLAICGLGTCGSLLYEDIASDGFLETCIAGNILGIALIALGIYLHRRISRAKKRQLEAPAPLELPDLTTSSMENPVAIDIAPTGTNVQDTSTQPTRKPLNKKKVGIIAGFVILICIISCTAITYRNSKIQAEQEAEIEAIQQYNDYIDNFYCLYLQAHQGASTAESVCVLTYNVWHDKIYNDSSDETEKYLKNTSDFNDAVYNVYADTEIKKKLSAIKDTQSSIRQIMQELQSCPDEMNKCYDAAVELSTAFNSLAELALTPTGTLTSYTSSEQSKVDTYLTAEQTLSMLIPSKKDRPYFDDETKEIVEAYSFANCLNQTAEHIPSNITVKDYSLFGTTLLSGATDINGITGTVSFSAMNNSVGVFDYITWKADKPDDATIEKFVEQMTLLYGEEYQPEDPQEGQHTWSLNNANYYINLSCDDEKLNITWMYTQ